MKALWYVRALCRKIFIQRKLKPIIAYLTDSSYRKDVRLIQQHTSFGATTVDSYVPFNQLRPSHKIHYWDWVFKLRNRIARGERIDRSNPLEVSYQPESGTYLVVDGNHRLQAMIESRKYQPTDMVKVKKYRKAS